MKEILLFLSPENQLLMTSIVVFFALSMMATAMMSHKLRDIKCVRMEFFKICYYSQTLTFIIHFYVQNHHITLCQYRRSFSCKTDPRQAEQQHPACPAALISWPAPARSGSARPILTYHGSCAALLGLERHRYRFVIGWLIHTYVHSLLLLLPFALTLLTTQTTSSMMFQNKSSIDKIPQKAWGFLKSFVLKEASQ